MIPQTEPTTNSRRLQVDETEKVSSTIFFKIEAGRQISVWCWPRINRLSVSPEASPVLVIVVRCRSSMDNLYLKPSRFEWRLLSAGELLLFPVIIIQVPAGDHLYLTVEGRSLFFQFDHHLFRVENVDRVLNDIPDCTLGSSWVRHKRLPPGSRNESIKPDCARRLEQLLKPESLIEQTKCSIGNIRHSPIGLNVMAICGF